MEIPVFCFPQKCYTESMEALRKKQLKNEINLLSLALIVYTLVTYAVVTGDLLLRVTLNRLLPGDFTEGLLLASSDSAWSEIAASLLGILVLFCFSRPQIRFADVFRTRQRMPFSLFTEVLCVFASCQLITVWLDDLLEYCLNLIGFTLSESVDFATASSTNLSQLLFACVVAPVGEEIVYRGFCMKRLQGQGHLFAIVLSALLFGVMHANLAQMAFAFLVGLILGFVAIEYSVLYAIALHVINNFLFGDLLSFAYNAAPDALFSMVFYFLFGVLFFCAVLVLVQRRKQIAAYIRAHRPEKGAYGSALTSVLLLVFIAMNLVLSLLLIRPLQA